MANSKKKKQVNKDTDFIVDDSSTKFEKSRVKAIQRMYADQESTNRWLGNMGSTGTNFTSALEIRNELNKSIISKKKIVEYSKRMYAVNPIYSALIEYFANMFLWRYVVIPHELPEHLLKSKPLTNFKINQKEYEEIYQTMLEIVEGINIEAKAPKMLTNLFIEGACYFGTNCDNDSMTINTILFPSLYCKKIGETQFGTAAIQFDFSYFNDLSFDSEEQKQAFLETFPQEIQDKYKIFENDDSQRWQDLDPRYSSCLVLNDQTIPTFVYSLGSILNFEKYGDNELKRNNNLLRYIVTHKLPIYQDNLIFEMDEVEQLHKGLAKIVNINNDVRLMTTFGDIDIKKIQDGDKAENKTLEKAYNSIFNNAGLNATLFTGESVEAIKMAILKDKAQVWKYVEQLVSFYNVAVNSWFDFGNYQVDFQVLPISPYSYADDIEHYRANATLGVGKIDYMVASGVKQKNITDRFTLEKFLKLDKITPLQSSYTQSGKNSGDKKAPLKENIDEDEKVAAPSPKNTKVEEKKEKRGKDEEK